jgi:hypothetical protein
MSRKTIEILFLICLMAITVAVIGGAMRYAFKSFLLPLLVGIPILVLMIVQIARESLSREGAATSSEPKKARWRGLVASGALVGLIFLIYLFGFLMAVPLAVFAYVIFSGEKWYFAVGLGLIMFVIVFVLYRILGLYLYEGILFS